MSGVFPTQILNNKPVSKQKRGNTYASPGSPEEPKEDPIMATAEQIAQIIAQATIAMQGARVGAVATKQYVQNPSKADINSVTPGGLKLYLKAVGTKEKDEERLKIS